MTLTVREARADEYEEVARLTVEAYEEYAASLSDESWEHYRSDLADVAGRAGKGQILVAEDGDHLLGAVAYYPPGPRPGGVDWWWWPEDYAYFRALAVHPAARMRGVGRALALACVQRARDQGASGVALNTTSVMPVAQTMYERLGFRRVVEGVPESHSEVGLMCYVMELSSDGARPSRPTRASGEA